MFDRSKIAHVTTPIEGYALVNGCQGLFLNEIFWEFEAALERFNELKRGECGADEQIVRVKVSIIKDKGDPRP